MVFQKRNLWSNYNLVNRGRKQKEKRADVGSYTLTDIAIFLRKVLVNSFERSFHGAHRVSIRLVLEYTK